MTKTVADEPETSTAKKSQFVISAKFYEIPLKQLDDLSNPENQSAVKLLSASVPQAKAVDADHAVPKLLNALKEQGHAKVIAEPTLVIIEGKKSHFHSGEKLAILVPDRNGKPRKEYRDIGLKLDVLVERSTSNRERLRVEITPEMSEINTGLTVQGVPGITTVRAHFLIEIANGQSVLAIFPDPMKKKSRVVVVKVACKTSKPEP
jgi:Flp pilus assembly secretin CpaC